MDQQQVISNMAQGVELRNHGKGWWLIPPQRPYQRRDSQHVPDEVVAELEQAGRISVRMRYNSLVASLTTEQEAAHQSEADNADH